MSKKVLLPLLLATCARAAEEPDYQDCIDESGGGTSLVSACMEKEYQRQEARLNSAWQQALTTLPPDRQQALREVQRAWIRYRELKCRFFHHPRAGSGGLLDMQFCLIEETRRRAGELAAL